ncbi:MAG: hypothetical protein PW788_08910 [Micavibrio sp.]|nr:hypothetical protein [Micavibrio sp.]
MTDKFDPLQDLRDKREKIEEKINLYKTGVRRQAGEMGFWTLIGGVAIAADFAILGGIGTGIAVLSGATIFSFTREMKKLEKQLEKIDERIDRLVDIQLEQQKNQPQLKKGLAEEFSPAAQKEIDLLRARLEDLEKQVDKARINDNDNTLDKPKFKPPKPPQAG